MVQSFRPNWRPSGECRLKNCDSVKYRSLTVEYGTERRYAKPRRFCFGRRASHTSLCAELGADESRVSLLSVEFRRGDEVATGAVLLLATVSTLSTVLSLAAVRDTRAATIDTYDFTQGGYVGIMEPFFIGAMTGRFTGAVEANGFIELADLSSLTVSVAFTFELGMHSTVTFDGPVTFFSFDTAGGSSSLALATADGVGATACVGAAASFGFPGCGSGGVNGSIFGGAITSRPRTFRW